MKSLNEMTRSEFEALPGRGWDEDIGPFRGLVLLPAEADVELHDSGYRCMDFVAVDENLEPMCRLAGCCDVIHINGIGGYGKWCVERGIPKLIPPIDWSVDCLPVSGLLHLWASGHVLTCGAALSSFEIYAERQGS